jgi:hypothetical protein
MMRASLPAAPGVTHVDVGEALWRWVPHVASRPEVGPAFIEEFGTAGIASAIADRLRDVENDCIVDSVRHQSTYRKLASSFPDTRTVLVFVEVEPDTAAMRLESRYDQDRVSLSRQSIYNTEVRLARGAAEIVVDNNGSQADLAVAALNLVAKVF